MTYDLSKHPYFETWTDPETRVESLILTERVAPLQKALYFVTPSISADGRWLWFHACFPPSRQRMLAAVSLDPDEPRIRLFPQTAGARGPMVAPEGHAAYVPINEGIYRQPFDGEIEEILRMPRRIIQKRHLFGLVTELTISADGRYFVLDSHIGNRWLISIAEIATGKVIPLRWFANLGGNKYLISFDFNEHAAGSITVRAEADSCLNLDTEGSAPKRKLTGDADRKVYGQDRPWSF